MWAASQGHELVVNILLENNAKNLEVSEEEFSNIKKPRKAADVGRYNPLHWAAFNGHNRVVWVLMRKGFSPLDIDMYGNNSIH
jgi:ankyrin repeat protein